MWRSRRPSRRLPSKALVPVPLARVRNRGDSKVGRFLFLGNALSDVHVVILAAGKGTRMKSAVPKVLHEAAGFSLLEYVLRAADPLAPSTTVVVVGYFAERVKDAFGKRLGLRFALQDPQLGTGHALMQAEPHLQGATGTVVLLYGDVPLLRPATLRALVDTHVARAAAATVVTARVGDPHGYGRIVREGGRIAAIVEEKDA